MILPENRIAADSLVLEGIILRRPVVPENVKRKGVPSKAFLSLASCSCTRFVCLTLKYIGLLLSRFWVRLGAGRGWWLCGGGIGGLCSLVGGRWLCLSLEVLSFCRCMLWAI